MSGKWVNKVAVVTGASAGIGGAIFQDLARHGLIVIGLARRVEKIEELINELGQNDGKVHAYKCDVSDPNSVKDAFKWIEEKFGIVHILVNNAGIGRNCLILDENEDSLHKINEVLDTNVRGLVQCSREAYRLMLKADDYCMIININSVLGHNIPFLGRAMNIYPSTKFAVTAITETIRQELVMANNKKIRVSSISPGSVDTDIRIAAGIMSAEESKMHAKSGQAMLKSEDVSNVLMFLLNTPYSVNVTEVTIKSVGEKF